MLHFHNFPVHLYYHYVYTISHIDGSPLGRWYLTTLVQSSIHNAPPYNCFIKLNHDLSQGEGHRYNPNNR